MHTKIDSQLNADNGCEITNPEKTLAASTSLIAGFGASGTTLGIYSLLTTSIAAAGTGVLLVGLTAVIGVSIASGLCFLLALPIAYWNYKNYLDTAYSLIQQINALQREKEILANEFIAAQHDYFIALLRLYLLGEENKNLSNKYEIDHLLDSSLPAFFNKNLAKSNFLLKYISIEIAQSHPLLKEKIKQNKKITKEEQEKINQYVGIYFQSNLNLPVLAPLKVSYLPALKMGAAVFIGATGTALGITYGISALILGCVTIAAISTPFIGWAFLASALLVGAFAGLAVAYCRYKNTKRAAIKDQLLTEKNEITMHKKQLLVEQEKIKTSIKYCKMQADFQDKTEALYLREKMIQEKEFFWDKNSHKETAATISRTNLFANGERNEILLKHAEEIKVVTARFD